VRTIIVRIVIFNTAVVSVATALSVVIVILILIIVIILIVLVRCLSPDGCHRHYDHALSVCVSLVHRYHHNHALSVCASLFNPNRLIHLAVCTGAGPPAELPHNESDNEGPNVAEIRWEVLDLLGEVRHTLKPVHTATALLVLSAKWARSGMVIIIIAAMRFCMNCGLLISNLLKDDGEQVTYVA
jgi:hypothetical protein